MSFLEDPASIDHDTTMIEVRDETFCQDDKVILNSVIFFHININHFSNAP